MKKSIFLPMFITIGLLSFRPLDAANSAKCSKLQSYVLAGKNKLYSPESKNATFMDAIHIERGFKTLLFGDRMDYGAAQFWLDHGVAVSQDLKDNKLREALCFRTCAGIEFWLENGANLANLTAKHCKDGLAKGAAWVETDADGKMVLFVDSGRYMDAGMMLFPGESSDQQMFDLLKSYGVSQVKFWYDFNVLVRDPEVYLTQIQSGARTGL